MASWIYLFSKFTPEALLFEALFIFILVSSYASFWILRKRRFGAVDTEVPSSVVKTYLNDLIVDAEQLRTQLFGLLSAAGAVHGSEPSLMASTTASTTHLPGVTDPVLREKISSLESKMLEQAKAMEKIVSEKTRLEKELSEAKSKGAAGGGSDGPGEEEVVKLKEKVESLEARLAEYSVIEDDLANLKRLQQENAQLKTALGGKAPTAPAPASQAEASPVTEKPSAETPEASQPGPAQGSNAAEPTLDSAASQGNRPEDAEAQEAVAAAAAPVEAVAAQAPEIPSEHEGPTLAESQAPSAAADEDPSPLASLASPASTGDVNFEGLVDEVEKSLEPGDAAAPVINISTQDTPKPKVEKSDEDLIAEFEKMLNS